MSYMFRFIFIFMLLYLSNFQGILYFYGVVLLQHTLTLSSVHYWLLSYFWKLLFDAAFFFCCYFVPSCTFHSEAGSQLVPALLVLCYGSYQSHAATFKAAWGIAFKLRQPLILMGDLTAYGKKACSCMTSVNPLLTERCGCVVSLIICTHSISCSRTAPAVCPTVDIRASECVSYEWHAFN